MTVKELSQLYWLNREIELDQQRLDSVDDEIIRDEDYLAYLELWITSPSVSNYDVMPDSNSFSCKMENDIVRIVELQDSSKRKKVIRSDVAMTIQAKQIQCLTKRSKLERYISGMPDSLLRMKK